MDNIINILNINIGIFYKDRTWKNTIHDLLMTEAKDLNCLSSATIDKLDLYDHHICIKFLPVSINSRGHKFDKVFYQPYISHDILNDLVRPMILFNRAIPLFEEDCGLSGEYQKGLW